MSPEYKAIIENNNITVITEKSQIDELFDLTTLGKIDELPTIKTDVPTIIIFDTPEYNSAYVLDEFVKFKEATENLENFKNFVIGANKLDNEIIQSMNFQKSIESVFQNIENRKNINIVYCDNVEVIDYIFKPFFQSNTQLQATNESIIRPAILIINTFVKDIYITIERLQPLTVSDFITSYNSATVTETSSL